MAGCGGAYAQQTALGSLLHIHSNSNDDDRPRRVLCEALEMFRAGMVTTVSTRACLSLNSSCCVHEICGFLRVKKKGREKVTEAGWPPQHPSPATSHVTAPPESVPASHAHAKCLLSWRREPRVWDAQITYDTFFTSCQKAGGTWSVRVHSCCPRPETPTFPSCSCSPCTQLPGPGAAGRIGNRCLGH